LQNNWSIIRPFIAKILTHIRSYPLKLGSVKHWHFSIQSPATNLKTFQQCLKLKEEQSGGDGIIMAKINIVQEQGKNKVEK
jgi:hypothetical protein